MISAPGIAQITLAAALLTAPVPVHAQAANQSATDNADDAFGESVGTDTVGIYTETNVRGFNPQQAGNARIEGVFFDQLTPMTFRIKTGSTIRVGQAALDFASPAPTGIVANRLHAVGDETIASLKLNSLQYGGSAQELDTLIALVPDRFTLVAGLGHITNVQPDGARFNNFSYGLMPRIKLGSFTIMPFAGGFLSRFADARPIVTTNGPYLPEIPQSRRYLGQSWANNKVDQITNGITVRGMLTDRLGFRGGMFQSILNRKRNYSEIFALQDADGLARHRVLADPVQNNKATSWEALFYYRPDNEGDVRQTFLASVRSRRRHIESGGSDAYDFGTMQWTEADPQPKPDPIFRPVNVGSIRQTSYALGYFGRVRGVGQLTLGISKSVYDAGFQSPAGTTSSSASPWLYNAGLRLRPFDWLTVYGAYVTGLEDSGSAPENAENRNQQLPASSTQQIEAGVSVKWSNLTWVTSLFRIKKPYFSYDADRRFAELGTVQHRGMEMSLAGKLTDRLTVLAGGVWMDPIVTGAARDLGIVGKSPVGVPKIHSRIDLSYHSAIWNGLTFSATLFHDSKRPASSGIYNGLGGRQLFLPAVTTFDLGLRHSFKIDETPVHIRFLAANIFDKRSWKVLSGNAFQLDEQRRFSLYVTGDF